MAGLSDKYKCQQAARINKKHSQRKRSKHNLSQGSQGQSTWVGTNHRPTNHRPDRPSQNATAQSGAWEARQAIPEGMGLDRLSQSAWWECTR